MYVIFVDDEEADQLLVKECLSQSGLSNVLSLGSITSLEEFVSEVKNGKKEKPALALLDMQLHDDEECGLKMLSLVRKSLPDVPAIILSRAVIPSVVRGSYEKGAASYIQKDIDKEKFQSSLLEMSNYWTNVCVLPNSDRGLLN